MKKKTIKVRSPRRKASSARTVIKSPASKNKSSLQSPRVVSKARIKKSSRLVVGSQTATSVNEERLDYALDATRDGLWDWEIQTGKVFYSAQWARLLGYRPDEVSADVKFFLNLLHPDDVEQVKQALELHMSGQSPVKQGEVRLRMKSGEYRWFLDRGKVVQRDASGKALRMVGTITDISSRKESERELQQMNRLYVVLGEINHLIVREKDPQALLENTCKIAVEKGGLHMAWIGLVNAPKQRVDTVASAGFVDGYLDGLQIDLRQDNRAMCPTKSAIVTGKHQIFNDVERDPRFAKWKDTALKRRFRACGVFPIQVEDRVVGSFNLYSSATHFFNSREIGLLDKLAMDIGFALDVIEKEQERLRISQELVLEHARLRQIIDSQLGFVVVLAISGVVKEVSQTPLTVTGFTRKQVLGRRFWEVGWLMPEAEEQCRAGILQASQGMTWRCDVLARAANGTPCDIDTVFSPIRDSSGLVVDVMGFGVDVTERNQSATALKENQRILSTLISNLPGMVYRCINDSDWTMVFVSDGCREVTGYDKSEMEMNRVLTFGDLVHPEDRDWLKRKCQISLDERVPCDNEYRIIDKSGAIRWVWERAAGHYSSDGALLSVEGFVQDITSRKHTEQTMLMNKQRLRTIFEAEPECVKLVGSRGELIEMNPAGLVMLEAESIEQVRKVGLGNFLLPSYRAAFAKLIEGVMKGESGFLEFEIRGLRGTRRWLETHAAPMREHTGEITMLLGITRDTTQRKITEQALRASEYRWKFAIEGAGDGLWDWDLLTNYVFFSPRWKEMLGYADDELANRFDEWETRVHEDDKAQALLDVQAHLEGRTQVYVNEHRLRCKDGSWKWILDRGVVVARDASNKPLRMIGTHHDITARKKALEAQKNNELRFRKVIDSLPLGLAVVNSRGKLQMANISLLNQFGYEAEELIGQSVEILVPQRFGGSHVADREAYQHHAKSRPMGRGRDLFGTRKDGSEFPVEIGLQPFQFSDEKMTLAVVTDISERKQVESALRTAEQLAATGRLAAGIAHEINNPLAGIRSAFAIVKTALPEDHPDIRFARMIDREIERISGIVGQMFSLYKPRAEKPQDFEFTELLQEVAELSRPKADAKGVQLVVEVESKSIPVFHPPGALSQVLLNLVSNAVHATPSGTTVRLVVVQFRDQIIVTVADQGPGIPEELRERVFEPFFSTKTGESGAGMGLGLSVSRSLMEMMGGQLELVIAPKGETTFCITLPLKMSQASTDGNAMTSKSRPGKH